MHTDDIEAMTYEQARDELIHVVQRLESGDQPLEASLALWERGEALAGHCQQWLDGARARLDAARAASPAEASPAAAVGGPAAAGPSATASAGGTAAGKEEDR